MTRQHAGVTRLASLLLIIAMAVVATGCSTAPKAKDRNAFRADARAATDWFESNVDGLRQQIDNSAGYIIYPAVGQWGTLFGGGNFGRGILNRPDGRQLGWAAINTTSLGLQVGVRGFKMLVVLQDADALRRFTDNKLTGSVSATAVVAEAGGGTRASFSNGVAVYQGASTGLIAGVNVGLDYMRYESLAASP